MQQANGESSKTLQVKIDASGRVIIPAETQLRKSVKEGEPLFITEDEHGVHIKTLMQSVREAQELFRPYVPEGRSMVDELIAERRAEAERE